MQIVFEQWAVCPAGRPCFHKYCVAESKHSFDSTMSVWSRRAPMIWKFICFSNATSLRSIAHGERRRTKPAVGDGRVVRINSKLTIVEDSENQCKRPTMIDAIVNISRHLIPLYICRRFLGAFGESIGDIQLLIMKYYCGTRDTMYSYRTEWYASNPTATIVELIRALKEAVMHNLVERLEFVLGLTTTDRQTDRYW